jgi:hypothetical protein
VSESIKSDPSCQTLDAQRQEAILKGKEIYINGLRSAVREAGLDVDQFNVAYGLLSTHIHSTPASVYRRSAESEPVFGLLPGFQYTASSTALLCGVEVMGVVGKRVMNLYPPEIF